jgi:hypothetical protein
LTSGLDLAGLAGAGLPGVPVVDISLPSLRLLRK